MTKASESNTEEREDEEENDEDEEKIAPGENVDPERLKAFNVSSVTWCIVLLSMSCEKTDILHCKW